MTGELDVPGLVLLRQDLLAALEAGTTFLAIDLSMVTGCDDRMFAVLAEINTMLCERNGWMRLVGLSEGGLAALDTAPASEVLMVYRASDWVGSTSLTGGTVGAPVLR